MERAKKEREGLFLGHVHPWWRMMEKKEKKVKSGWGQVLVLGGRVVVVVVGDPGWSGKRNVGLLECLEQSGIIEWIWNKKRQTEVPQWKNVLLGRLKKHSIHSDSFTGPRTFLRWHHREYKPPLHPPFLLTYAHIHTLGNTALPFTLFLPYTSHTAGQAQILLLYTVYSLPLKFVYII